MPNFSIVKQSKIKPSFRVDSVRGRFDLQIDNIKETFDGDISFENDKWQIGVIVGNSGTGKTTIVNKLFKDCIIKKDFNSQSVIDDMPKTSTFDEITTTFNSVGFSSAPSWLKPYSVLSNGEKMRVDLAYAILLEQETIVFDEFTSVVDRNIAKISSCALSKTIRRQNKKIILVSCHNDILEWLEPDWIFSTNNMKFVKKNSSDQKLNYQFLNVKEMYGKCLINITI